MSLFNKMKEPVFLRESSDLERQIEQLRELEPLLNTEGRAKLNQEIRCLEYGIIGERNIAYELKNSHMPMYILHDIYLESGELSAQIDYLVFTRKLCFVIECKNLYGNIEINSAGDFIRTMEWNGKWKKEGIYSPITQNQRHLELMKLLKTEQQKNPLKKLAVGRFFSDFYRTVVVLANPKTVLNTRYAKREVKEKVIRADQLVAYIKNICSQSKEAESSDERLYEWANSFLAMNQERDKDYTGKYDVYRLEHPDEEAGGIGGEDKVFSIKEGQERGDFDQEVLAPTAEKLREQQAEVQVLQEPSYDTPSAEAQRIEDSALYKELKAYRLSVSRQEKIKAYYIFNDSQLRNLVVGMPKTKTELLSVPGFGPVKVETYGTEILEIVNRHS